MGCCKTEMLPLRVMLFALYGGISCILPFMQLHMSTLGLTEDERSWLHFVVPFAACVVPVLGASLADRIGHYRTLFVVSLVLCGAAYPCLLLVPPVVRHPPRQPELFLRCGAQGSLIGSELCQAGCSLGDEVERGYYLDGCKYQCDEDAGPPPPTPPHLCLEGTGIVTQCEVVDVDQGVMVNASLPRLMQREGEPACWYPLVSFSRGGQRYRSLVCGQLAGCHVRCNLRQLSERPLFGETLCRRADGHPARTLWLYFAVRVTTETFLALAIVLATAGALLQRRRHGQDYGCETFWAMLGLAAFAPACGYLLDVQPLSPGGGPDLRPSLYAFAALMLVSAVLGCLLPSPQATAEGEAWMYSRLLAKSFFSCEMFGSTCALLLLGVLWGFLETFLAGHARTLGGTHLQTGLSLSAGVLLTLPVMVRAEAIISYCGYHHVCMVAFILYIVRYVSYAYIVSPWLLLPSEALEMVTLHLAWVSAVLFTSGQAPPRTEATLQAAITVAHYGVGRGIGAGVVRYVLPLTSGYLLLCAGSILSAVIAALYLLIYYCCRMLRPDATKRVTYSSEGAMLNRTWTPT